MFATSLKVFVVYGHLHPTWVIGLTSGRFEGHVGCAFSEVAENV